MAKKKKKKKNTIKKQTITNAVAKETKNNTKKNNNSSKKTTNNTNTAKKNNNKSKKNTSNKKSTNINKNTTKQTQTQTQNNQTKKKNTNTTHQTKKNTSIKKKKEKIEIKKIKEIDELDLTKQIKLPLIDEKVKHDEELLSPQNQLQIVDSKKASKSLIIKCKEMLNLPKILKKSTKEKYNIDRHRKVSSKEKKPKLTRKERKAYRKEQLNNDELVLLRYRDHKGFKKFGVFFKNRIKVIKYDMRRFKKRLKYGTLKDKLLILIMLCMIAGFCCVIAFCAYVVVNAPEISEKRLYKTNSTVLYDDDGVEFARLGTENREKVNYEQLPQVLVDAIIATEDSRYFQHNGIDIARFTKAAIGQVLGHSDAGGGSTLTMQVSKNAATSVVSSGIQGIVRKFTDVYLSVFIFEQKYTKEQIIEFYVNIPYLGASSYGVEQASQTYFGKSVSELTLTEAALIAGLFQAPDAYDPYNYPEKAESRKNTVLNLMYRHGYITKKQKDTAQSIPVEALLVPKDTTYNEFQGFIDTVVSEVIERTKTDSNPNGDNPYNIPMKIYTTMDRKKQIEVNKVSTGEAYKFKNDVSQTGIAVVDKKGAMPAIVNGRYTDGKRLLNYATSAANHPGSTAKPIIDYGPAIEYLDWSTGQTILDEQMTYTGGAKIRNFDSKFKGVMTIKEALAQSRNIPALFTFQQTTHEQKLTFASNMGWELLTDGNGHILETCSIGGFDGTTPLQVAAAYATFARGGTYIEPYSFTKIEYTESGDIFEVEPKKVEVMSEETAYMINMILKYAVTSGKIGTGSIKGTDIAAKTGTSTVGDQVIKDLGIKGNIIGDAWAAVYSPDYAVGIWYGYPRRTKEHYLTNTEANPARTALTKFMVKAIFEKNSRFKKPSGVTTAEIEIGTDPLQLASEFTPKSLRSKEYFKKGTVPTEVSTRFSRLENPTNLNYVASATTVTLNWTPIATPNAINTEYLTNYFTESNAYKKWVEKSLKDRLEYNQKNIGVIGYHVYMTNANGTKDLGFTTNTTFTANVLFDTETKFTVKASYSIFKANQSTGVTINVQPNSSTPQDDPSFTTTTTKSTTASTSKVTFSISFKKSGCTTLDDYNALGNAPEDKIVVKSNGKDVTNDAQITVTACYHQGEVINCSEMTKGKKYNVLFSILYKGQRREKEITIDSTC